MKLKSVKFNEEERCFDVYISMAHDEVMSMMDAIYESDKNIDERKL